MFILGSENSWCNRTLVEEGPQWDAHANANMFIKSTQCSRDRPRPAISYYYFNSYKFMEFSMK